MTATLYDPRQCLLGEGPLWHPERQQLFWFDILGLKLLSRENDQPRDWQFSEIVSAAGWISHDQLLIASETQLFVYDLESAQSDHICKLESDDPTTRSNDGRADPMGGFWIGTMGKAAEKNAGAIYRYYKGELRKLFPNITIPNSICFAPDGRRAYFADTLTGLIMRQPLDAEGWPKGDPELHIDLRAEGLNPDGSVTDAHGNLWNAQWGAARVACYAPDGTFKQAIKVPGLHSSCPAFGGQDMTSLFCTTAQELLSPDVIAAHPENGRTFVAQTDSKGWPEPRVIL